MFVKTCAIVSLSLKKVWLVIPQTSVIIITIINTTELIISVQLQFNSAIFEDYSESVPISF